jgi:hypothetical protein
VVKQLTLTVLETEGCCGKHEAGVSARHRPLGSGVGHVVVLRVSTVSRFGNSTKSL